MAGWLQRMHGSKGSARMVGWLQMHASNRIQEPPLERKRAKPGPAQPCLGSGGTQVGSWAAACMHE